MLISSLELDHTLSVIKRGSSGSRVRRVVGVFPLLLECRDIGGDI